MENMKELWFNNTDVTQAGLVGKGCQVSSNELGSPEIMETGEENIFDHYQTWSVSNDFA